MGILQNWEVQVEGSLSDGIMTISIRPSLCARLLFWYAILAQSILTWQTQSRNFQNWLNASRLPQKQARCCCTGDRLILYHSLCHCDLLQRQGVYDPIGYLQDCVRLIICVARVAVIELLDPRLQLKACSHEEYVAWKLLYRCIVGDKRRIMYHALYFGRQAHISFISHPFLQTWLTFLLLQFSPWHASQDDSAQTVAKYILILINHDVSVLNWCIHWKLLVKNIAWQAEHVCDLALPYEFIYLAWMLCVFAI